MTQFVKGDVQKWIGQAVAVRDKIKEIETRHDEELKEPKEVLEMLKGCLQNFFTETGQDSAPTGAGTAYLSTTYRASIADKQAFKDYVVESQRWDLMDWKANAKAAQLFVKKEKQLPPGVNLTGITKVNIRRPGQTTDNDEE